MTLFRSFCVYLAACVVVVASPGTVHAQQAPTGMERLSVQASIGTQAGSDDFTARMTPIIYDEAAVLDMAQSVSTGFLFDVGAAYRVTGNFLVGINYSRASGDGDAAIAAQIPDPLFFDMPRGASTTTGGLSRKENAIHLQAQYRYAVSPKLDLTVGVGPTFFNVSQELVGTVDVTETVGGPTIAPVASRPTDSPVGYNIGVDGTYLLTNQLGVGVLLRWASATADLEVPDSPTVSVDVGGFQIAGGVRYRF
jgi:hypothetical protein